MEFKDAWKVYVIAFRAWQKEWNAKNPKLSKTIDKGMKKIQDEHTGDDPADDWKK